MVKNPPADAKTHGLDPWVRKIPGEGTGSSILAWTIPCTEEPGGLRVTKESDRT